MRIYIGMPTAATIHAKTVASLISLQSLLMTKGHVTLIDVSISNTIHFIRNTMAWNALERQCDVLLFLDSDVMFKAEDVLRLIESDRDIATLAYRYKRPDQVYCCNILSDKDNLPIVDADGWIELEKAGTGIMCIRRRVLETLKEKLERRSYITKDGEPRVAFFEYILENGDYNGEDYYFCKRAREFGFHVWLWPNSDTGHIGINEYNGNIHYFLQGDHVSCLEYTEPVPAIDGWMNRLELNWLYQVAKMAGSVAEIGCWKGKATHAICSGCKGTVYAIDHFKGTPEDGHEVLNDEIYDSFKQNTAGFDNLQVLRMPSAEAAKEIDQVDVVFIDGDHAYEAVKQDLDAWDSKARKLICGHDYDNGRVGLKEAVDQKYGHRVKVFQTIWMVLKDEGFGQ
jgi:hypothetical protein